jgi:polysaccharide export outer membrane protein
MSAMSRIRPDTRWGMLVFGVAAIVASVGCGGGLRAYDYAAERLTGYRVGPSDRIKVEVWRHDELMQEVAVRPDGAISMPLIGDVPAAGRTTEQITADVAQRLTRFFQDKPTVTVSVTEVKSYRIYVVGEVTRGGEFSPTREINVMQALALSGGFTRYADFDRIVIIRKDERGERRIPFNISAVIEKGELHQNLTLQSGDTLYVP